MILFKLRVDLVKIGQIAGGFTAIIPFENLTIVLHVLISSFIFVKFQKKSQINNYVIKSNV